MAIIGHDRIIELLERGAAQERLAHGYLFFGQDRIGKRHVALGLARFLEGASFRGDVETPRGRALGNVPGRPPLSDCLELRPNEGSLGIDVIRSIRSFIFQRPYRSPYRTVIVDDAHRMTDEAQHALLKIAEEPPEAGLLILILRDISLLRSTLVSRLTPLFMSAPGVARTAAWLEDAYSLSARDAFDYASRGCGAPGQAAALLADKKIQKQGMLARELLKSKGPARKAVIKKIIQSVDFHLISFLDSLILEALSGNSMRGEGPFWHALLRLRHDVEHMPLNPRLQLDAILQKMR